MKSCWFCKYEGKQEDCWGILRRCNNPHYEHCLDDVLYGADCKYYKRKPEWRIKLDSYLDWIGQHAYTIAFYTIFVPLVIAGVITIICLLTLPVKAEYKYCFDKTCQTFQEDEIDHVETFKIKDKYFLKVVLTNGQDNNFCYGKDYMKLYSDFDDTVEMETYKKGISWKEYYRRWDNAVQRD